MTDLEQLSHRVFQMERRYRRMKRLALVFCMVLAAGGIMAQSLEDRILIRPQPIPSAPPVEHQVRARQFILVDNNNKERASLVADSAGSVFLVLFDRNEKSRANLSVSPDGPSLVFYDAGGQARMVLGSTTLVASHVNEKGVVERAPASSIVMLDRNGKLLFRTP